MAKKFIEVFDIGTEIVFLYKNILYKGIIKNFNMYNAGTIKYDIVTMIDKEEAIIKDVNVVFENKDAYVEYIKNLVV
jgi:hypothetical protein